MMTSRDKVTSALTQLAGEGRSKQVFLGSVRDMVSGVTKLCGPNAPRSAYDTLQQVCPGDAVSRCSWWLWH